MRYIDYKAMKDFYMIAEVCELFEVNMQKLRQYSEQYCERRYRVTAFRNCVEGAIRNVIIFDQLIRNLFKTQTMVNLRKPQLPFHIRFCKMLHNVLTVILGLASRVFDQTANIINIIHLFFGHVCDHSSQT